MRTTILQDYRHTAVGQGISPEILPRCEEPIEDFAIACATDETNGGTVQNPNWSDMNGTEVFVKAEEANVKMFINISKGMPVTYNITRNGTFEKVHKRDSSNGRLKNMAVQSGRDK